MGLFGRRGESAEADAARPEAAPHRARAASRSRAGSTSTTRDSPGVDQVLDVRHGLALRATSPRSTPSTSWSTSSLEDGLAFLARVPPRPARRRHAPALDAEPRLGHATHYRVAGHPDEDDRGGLHPSQPRLPRLGPPVPLQPGDPRGGAPVGRVREVAFRTYGESERAGALGPRAARDLGGHAGAAPRPDRRGSGPGRAASPSPEGQLKEFREAMGSAG